MSPDKPYKEVFVIYTLHIGNGSYDKTGKLITETEDEIIFETASTQYRIIDDSIIERKQDCGWHALGTVENLAIREENPRYKHYY